MLRFTLSLMTRQECFQSFFKRVVEIMRATIVMQSEICFIGIYIHSGTR